MAFDPKKFLSAYAPPPEASPGPFKGAYRHADEEPTPPASLARSFDPKEFLSSYSPDSPANPVEPTTADKLIASAKGQTPNGKPADELPFPFGPLYRTPGQAQAQIRGAGQALPYVGTLVDEATAGIRAGKDKLAGVLGYGPETDFSTAYDEHLAEERQKNHESEKNYPQNYHGSQVAMGLAAPVRGPIPGRGFISSVANAGLFSAASGFGDSEKGTLAGRLENAGDAGIKGLEYAGALHGAAAAAGGAYKYLANRAPGKADNDLISLVQGGDGSARVAHSIRDEIVDNRDDVLGLLKNEKLQEVAKDPKALTNASLTGIDKATSELNTTKAAAFKDKSVPAEKIIAGLEVLKQQHQTDINANKIQRAIDEIEARYIPEKPMDDSQLLGKLTDNAKGTAGQALAGDRDKVLKVAKDFGLDRTVQDPALHKDAVNVATQTLGKQLNELKTKALDDVTVPPEDVLKRLEDIKAKFKTPSNVAKVDSLIDTVKERWIPEKPMDDRELLAQLAKGGKGNVAESLAANKDRILRVAKKFGLDKTVRNPIAHRDASVNAASQVANKIGEAYSELAENTEGLKFSAIVGPIEELQAEYAANPATSAEANEVAGLAQRMRSIWNGEKPGQALTDGELPDKFVEARKLRETVSTIQDKGFSTGSVVNPANAQALKRDMASTLKRVLDAHLDEQGVGEQIAQLNEDYSSLRQMSKAAKSRAAAAELKPLPSAPINKTGKMTGRELDELANELGVHDSEKVGGQLRESVDQLLREKIGQKSASQIQALEDQYKILQDLQGAADKRAAVASVKPPVAPGRAKSGQIPLTELDALAGELGDNLPRKSKIRSNYDKIEETLPGHAKSVAEKIRDHFDSAVDEAIGPDKAKAIQALELRQDLNKLLATSGVDRSRLEGGTKTGLSGMFKKNTDKLALTVAGTGAIGHGLSTGNWKQALAYFALPGALKAIQYAQRADTSVAAKLAVSEFAGAIRRGVPAAEARLAAAAAGVPDAILRALRPKISETGTK